MKTPSQFLLRLREWVLAANHAIINDRVCHPTRLALHGPALSHLWAGEMKGIAVALEHGRFDHAGLESLARYVHFILLELASTPEESHARHERWKVELNARYPDLFKDEEVKS